VKLSARGGSIVAAAATPAAWRRREDVLAERVTALHAAASQALGGEQNIGVIARVAAGDLAGAVAAMTAWCAGRLTAISPPQPGSPLPGDDAGAGAAELRAMLSQLRAVAAEAAEHDFGLHAQRLSDTSAALRRLGTTPTSAQLVDQACEHLVRGCGFSRAVLSRVESGTWWPWMAHFTGDGRR
jgi:hypothetical protein